MRVGAVGTFNTSYYNKSRNIKQNRVHNINRADVVSFKGLFNSEPDLSTRFKYGLEALDEQSILVVTSDEKSSNMMLEFYADKIDIPVMKKYTLPVKKGELKNQDELTSNFAIFKNGREYYILSLADHDLKTMLVANPKDDFDVKNKISSGDKKLLKDGYAIETGKLFFSGKNTFVFTTPNQRGASNAEKYLKVNNLTNYCVFNKTAISALKDQKNPGTGEKGFFFSDIGGLDNVIETLKKYVVRPINYPQVFENIRLNKGILLWGPPRCGKTLLGKALANEAGTKYTEFNANELKSGTVGASEASIRAVFKKAVSDAPSITFIDEIDSIAKKRDGSSNARFDDPMVNQLLGCMSDLEKTKAPAFIVAATNRKDLLDPALLASGRFGLHLEVPLPDEKGLKQIFNIHAKNKPISEEVSADELAKMMSSHKFNGSDVAEMVTDAYFYALERLGMFEKMDNKTFSYADFQKIAISKEDFHLAMQKIVRQKI